MKSSSSRWPLIFALHRKTKSPSAGHWPFHFFQYCTFETKIILLQLIISVHSFTKIGFADQIYIPVVTQIFCCSLCSVRRGSFVWRKMYASTHLLFNYKAIVFGKLCPQHVKIFFDFASSPGLKQKLNAAVH